VRFQDTKEARVYVETADVKFYIVGELHAGCVFNQVSMSIDVSPTVAGDLATWIDRTVTLVGDDTYADVEAVILSYRISNSNADWNARRKGSTWAETFLGNLNSGCGWMPVGTDSNGQYQVYVTGKAEPFGIYTQLKEIGYIKKGTYNAITNPTDEEVAASSGAWATVDLSGTIPEGGRVACVKWGWQAGVVGNPESYLREFGSTNSIGGRVYLETQVTSPIVKLSSDRECEYTLGIASMDLYVLGYEDYSPIAENSTVIIDGDEEGGALSIDGGKLIIDSG
jgi:hypothetical protein